MAKRSGFILIIVVGLLGVLAFLALEFAEKARQAKTLSSASMLDTHAHLLARSGIEKGRQKLMAVIAGGSLAPPMEVGELKVVLPVPADGRALVHLGDANGKICLNDGIAAGKAENASHPIPGGYKANALDPWPAPGMQDISAWINYRLRSILNSYGDVHKFAAEIGWPSWERELDVNGNEVKEPTYGQTPLFQHTATQSGPPELIPNISPPSLLTSSPPRLADGTVTSNPLLSAGLGDRIIGARPQGGYSHMDQIRQVVNDWGRDFLPLAYHLGNFYARVTQDFSLTAWHDTAFWRLSREFGRDDSLFPDQAAVYASWPPGGWQKSMRYWFSPPDLSDVWRPHPHPPVNLNAASLFVRAAVFQAPHSVPLITEGKHSVALPTLFGFSPASPTGNVEWVRPIPYCIGTSIVGGVAMENGVSNTVAGPTLTQCQAQKLLSVRDAMIVSGAYEAIAQEEGWPDDFERFVWHLRRMLMRGRSAENIIFNNWDCLLPHVFSAQRRLPGWMGAPIALISETWWSRSGGGYSNGNFPNLAGRGQDFTNGGGALRFRIEDFVFRSQLPKVCFRSGGLYVLDSAATLAQGPLVSRRTIRTSLKAFETRVIRDQDSFQNVTQTGANGTSPEIMIGPEEASIASPYLGTVGLKDRGESLPGSGVKAARYDFNGSLEPEPGWSLHHQDPQSDPHNVAGSGYNYVDADLLGTALESGNVSIFPRGPGFDPRDLSPFGGVYFSPFRHDVLSLPRFSDSFYFRPETFLSTPASHAAGNLISELGGKGLISLWVRVPTLAQHWDNIPSQIFHLTLWERRDTIRANGTLDAGRLRPVTLALSCIPRKPTACFLTKGFLQYDFEFQVGVGNASTVVGTRQEVWGNLANIPKPATQAIFLNNPLYNSMLFPWVPSYDPALWPQQFTAPQNLATPYETGWRQRWKASTDSTNVDGIDDFVPSPYTFRAGSWVRLTCLWDSGSKTSLRNRFTMVPHSLKGVTVDTVADKSPGMVNPKMCLSFGEAIYPFNTSFGNLGAINLMPSGRLNSLIDNVVMQFGGYPSSFNPPTPSLQAVVDPLDGGITFVNTENSERVPADHLHRWDAIQATPGFDSRRYDIRPSGHANGKNEPAWVINSGLPKGSRLLEFGARIYDVPFYPHYAPDLPDPNNVPVCPPEPRREDYATLSLYTNAYDLWNGSQAVTDYRNYMIGSKAYVGWTTWPVKAPRIEMDVLDFNLADPSSAPILPSLKSLPVIERDISIKSPAWGRYSQPVDDNLRLRLRYMSRDTDDRPLDDVLTDIPYVQEVNWRWVPPGGMKILSWEQE